MRALKKLEAGRGLTLVDAPLRRLGPRDVAIRVSMAGLCGTDRHIFEWDTWAAGRVRLGTTIGHEFTGIVHDIGDYVRRVRPGDRVNGEGHIGCGQCQPCRTGNGHICERVDILGIDIDGCFADFVILPEENVWPLPAEIPDRVATILDPLGNAVHTVMAAGVSGRSVLVTGCGVIGLMAVAIARAVGAGLIIATDVNRERLERARAMGADHILDAANADWPIEARSLTHGQGPEVLLEMSGAPGAIQAGLRAVRNGGTTALLGLPSDKVTLDLTNDVIFKGLKILGINGRRIFETWYQAQELLVSGRLDVSLIITHEVPFIDAAAAFDLLASGEGLKILLMVDS